MKHSLQTRLTLSILVIIVVTAGLVVWLANCITADRFVYMVSRAGQMQAYRLAPLFADYYAQTSSWQGVEMLIENYLDAQFPPGRRGQQGRMMGMMMGVSNDGGRFLLVDMDGRVIADSEGQLDGTRTSADNLDKGAPIIVGDQQVGTLIIASGLGMLAPDQVAFLTQVKTLMLVAAVVAGLAVLVVGSLQARRIVAPVRALADAARRVADGDLSQRVTVSSQDELGEMALAFNAMAAQLEQQHELRRRAVTDIAHELRTPLSILQIDLESIEDGLSEATPDVIAGLQEEVALLNRLVEDLRTLSLAEAGELQLEVEPVDVARLGQRAIDQVRGVAREKDVALSAALPDRLPTVSGDVQRLMQVLLNLLSNALRHTPPKGRITVTARQVGDEVLVTVQDTGDGIPTDELPHVFERLYRTDRARTRDSGGSGLGLTIARSLIEAHDGRIWAQSVEGQGSTFTFALPILCGA
jgi:signal transduction histidine kinase